MPRCENDNKEDLEIHHIDRYGLATPENALILCQDCHEKTDTYGVPRDPSKEYYPYDDEELRAILFLNAKYRCQCEEDNCH